MTFHILTQPRHGVAVLLSVSGDRDIFTVYQALCVMPVPSLHMRTSPSRIMLGYALALVEAVDHFKSHTVTFEAEAPKCNRRFR